MNPTPSKSVHAGAVSHCPTPKGVVGQVGEQDRQCLETGGGTIWDKAQSGPIFHVIVDSREQRPFAFSGYPVTVEVGTLEAGDYSLAGFARRIAVERKSLQDLAGCLGTDRERFERELTRLRGYDFAAVVVETPAIALRQGRYLGRLDAGAAWQSVLAFSMRYRIPFWFCADRADAEAVTYDILRHYARDRLKEFSALQDVAKPKREAPSHVRACM